MTSHLDTSARVIPDTSSWITNRALVSVVLLVCSYCHHSSAFFKFKLVSIKERHRRWVSCGENLEEGFVGELRRKFRWNSATSLLQGSDGKDWPWFRIHDWTQNEHQSCLRDECYQDFRQRRLIWWGESCWVPSEKSFSLSWGKVTYTEGFTTLWLLYIFPSERRWILLTAWYWNLLIIKRFYNLMFNDFEPPVFAADINECELGIHNCSQHCNNIDPGFECWCGEGYELTDDGATCKGCNYNLLGSNRSEIFCL